MKMYLSSNFSFFLKVPLILLLTSIANSAFSLDFIVANTSDAHDSSPGDGKCESTLTGAPCTLRAAIEEKNAGSGGTIYIEPGDYQLTEGQLTISSSIALGATTASATHDNNVTIYGGGKENKHRIFAIEEEKLLVLANVNLKNGWAITNFTGGAVKVNRNAVLHAFNVKFEKNHVFGARGGAVSIARGGDAYLRGCMFINNGDYIEADGTVHNNNRLARHEGGAIIVSPGGRAEIQNSLMVGNKATYGGAIFVDWEGTVDIVNSTIAESKTSDSGSDNKNNQRGSAIHTQGGFVRINHSTINVVKENSSRDKNAIWGLGTLDWSSFEGDANRGANLFASKECIDCHITGQDPFDVTKFSLDLLKDKIFHTMYFRGKCDRQCSADIVAYIDEILLPGQIGSSNIQAPPSFTIGNSIISGSNLSTKNACGSFGEIFQSAGGNVYSGWWYSTIEELGNGCSLWGSDNSDNLRFWRFTPPNNVDIDIEDEEPLAIGQKYVSHVSSGFYQTPTAAPEDLNSGWIDQALESHSDPFFSCPTQDQTGYSRTGSGCDAGAFEWGPGRSLNGTIEFPDN